MTRFAIDDLKTFTDTMLVVEEFLLVYDQSIDKTLNYMMHEGYYDKEEMEELSDNMGFLLNIRSNLLKHMNATAADPYYQVA